MWYLKFKVKHSDCIYAPELEKLQLSVHFYHIGNYIKGNFIYTSSIQELIGNVNKIKRYIKYLKNHKKIVRIEVYGEVIFVLAKHRKDLIIYKSIYHSILLYPSPAYLGKDGYEVIEVACWDKKPLMNLIEGYEKNKTTEYFKILSFIERKLDNIYVSRLLPSLPKKQKEAITLAYQSGYYLFPRKISLDKLAKIAKVSKPTFRENLRKAEAKLIPKLISE